MDIGKLFFGQLVYDGNQAKFNELTFKVNAAKTHFDATSLIRDCSILLDVRDKKGYPGKSWATFMRGKAGQIPTESHYVDTNSKPKTRWVSFSELLPVLTYAMGDGNVVNRFLRGQPWINKAGFVYLVRCVVNGEVILKYGHTWNTDQRMIAYEHECDSAKLVCSCPVDNQTECETAIGEYIYSHGGIRHSRGCEWFTMGKPFNDSLLGEAYGLWIDGLDRYDNELLDVIICHEE